MNINRVTTISTFINLIEYQLCAEELIRKFKQINGIAQVTTQRKFIILLNKYDHSLRFY